MVLSCSGEDELSRTKGLDDDGEGEGAGDGGFGAVSLLDLRAVVESVREVRTSLLLEANGRRNPAEAADERNIVLSQC